MTMRLVDYIQIGPFATAYHQGIVGEAFLTALSEFLEREVVGQLDGPVVDAEGTLVATHGKDVHCAPTSLVRDFFTLDLTIFGDDGISELKGDIVYHPATKTFTPRFGHGPYFYLWTPSRKWQAESEKELIQQLVDDIVAGRSIDTSCPLCRGRIKASNDPQMLDVRCVDHECFVYSYHKDEQGRLLHGHFWTKHPAERARA